MESSSSHLNIASWNVNSVRTREEHLERFLAAQSPDVICLQELKGEDAVFPRSRFAAMGYEAQIWGQKSYNGVGLLSKTLLKDVERGLGDPELDSEARLISGRLSNIRIASVYVPQGSEIGCEKWDRKLRFLDALIQWCKRQLQSEEHLVLCGDFNIAPDDRDVWDVKRWANTVVTADEVRQRFQSLIDLGLYDARRADSGDAVEFSWWDYRHDSFNKNRGLRIDFTLASSGLRARQSGSGIAKEMRTLERPSDHAPIWVQFEA